jgi:hypothetical protein
MVFKYSLISFTHQFTCTLTLLCCGFRVRNCTLQADMGLSIGCTQKKVNYIVSNNNSKGIICKVCGQLSARLRTHNLCQINQK